MDSLCKIMLVEDEYLIRQGILDFFRWEEHGFTILGEASNGAEALEQILQSPPDILITDILMPKMDGLALIEAVHNSFPHVQVLVLSGHSDYGYVRNAFRLGVTDYILKPMLNPADLLAMLQKLRGQLQPTELLSPLSTDLPSLLRLFFHTGDPQLLPALSAQLPLPCYLLLGSRHCGTVAGELTDTPFQTFCQVMQDKAPSTRLVFFQTQEDFWALANLFVTDAPTTTYELQGAAAALKCVFPENFVVCCELLHTVQQLGETFQQISVQLSQLFYRKQTTFLRIPEPTPPTAVSLPFDEQTFGNLLHHQQFHQALAMLLRDMQQAVAQQFPERELKASAQNALYFALQQLEHHHVTGLNYVELKRSSFVALSTARFAEDYLQVLEKIVGELSSHLPNSGEMDGILRYIHENYTKKISLADLAHEFNFNYYYLSSYFTNHFHENFNDYINRLRIKNAKLLLCDTSVPISEVGDRCGYTDNSYFARVFKRTVGCSPSKYRQQMCKKGEAK